MAAPAIPGTRINEPPLVQAPARLVLGVLTAAVSAPLNWFLPARKERRRPASVAAQGPGGAFRRRPPGAGPPRGGSRSEICYDSSGRITGIPSGG